MKSDRPSAGPRVPGYLGDAGGATDGGATDGGASDAGGPGGATGVPLPRWPNIADYWPDAPQRMGPPADVHEDPAAAPTRIAPALPEEVLRPLPAEPAGGARSRRRRVRPLLGAAAAVLVLLGGGAVAYRKVADRNTSTGAKSVPPPVVTSAPARSGSPAPIVVQPPPSPAGSTRPSSSPSPTATVPATGTFWLVDDVSEISVSMARVNGGIARVGVPDGSDAVPRATAKGNTIRLAVGSRHRGGSTQIAVQLDNRISWAIRLGGGARRMTLDLRGALLRSVSFEQGVARIDLTLPRLSSTLPIRMADGVHDWRIRTDGEVAVDVLARHGGGKVVVYGRDRGPLGRGERLRVDGRAGIDVDAVGGFGTLTVAAT